ncbi:MAG: Ig-like domain-containing protein, partial [Bacteroidetes bacterium]|nr:Ig-like domain-containing protein [Bacteroidota bacterium]
MKKIYALFLTLITAVNCIYAAAISSKASGNWSSPSTWNGGVLPGANDEVTISSGNTVLLDMNVSVSSISVTGTLNADLTKNLSITTRFIMVHGAFNWGTELNPYTKIGIITLTGSDKTADVMGMGTKLIGAMGGGILNIHGKIKKAWTMLNASVVVGGTSITLQDAVDWEIGDEFIVTTTGREHDLDKKLSYTQTEKRTITAISADKKTITFSTPLNYAHFGQLQTFTNGTKSWVLDERAEVGVLTHNIKIQGDASSEANQFGGQIMSMPGCKAYVSGVELFRMGQAGLMGRYPFHWHMAGDVSGQYIKNSAVHHSYQRAVTVHASQNATVESNVCYDIKGHGIFLEDGNETKTLIKDNLISYVHKPDANNVIRPSDVFNLPTRNDGPAGIWVSHPTNDLVNNAVSSCGSGIWYALLEHPDGPSYDPTVWVNNQPLGNVDGNRTHGCYSGFIVDFADVENRTKTGGGHYNAPPGQVVKNATSFHCMRTLWWRGSSATFENAMTANPYSHQGGNVFTFYGVFKNSLMVGYSANQTSSPDVMMHGTGIYDGSQELIDCHFENFDKDNQAAITGIGGASKNLPMTLERCTKNKSHIMQSPVIHSADELHVYSSLLLDKTGSFLGAPNTWGVYDHPYLIDDVNFTKVDNQPSIGTYTTKIPFARLRYTIPGFNDNTPNKPLLYSDFGDGSPAYNRPLGPHWEMPLAVNTNRMYRFRFPDGIPARSLFSYMESRKGDKIKFFIEGVPYELIVKNSTFSLYNNNTPIRKVNNINELHAASDNVYFYSAAEKRMYFQLVNRGEYAGENIEMLVPSGVTIPTEFVQSRPYKSTNKTINELVQAEHFDHGGQNVAYYEKLGPEFFGKAHFSSTDYLFCRNGEAVDVKRISVGSTNFVIDDIKTNEWWNYTYTIPAAGQYKIKTSFASTLGTNTYRVLVDGVEVGRKTFAATSGYNVQEITANITAGTHVVRIEALTDGFTFDWLSIESTTVVSGAPVITITNPAEGASSKGNVTFTVNAYDPSFGTSNGNGISNIKFELKNGNTVVASSNDNSAPYEWTVNSTLYTNGAYQLVVTASSQDAQTTISTRTISINNPFDCAGVLNGTAFTDACGKCTGGNTGKSLCSDTLWDKGFELRNWPVQVWATSTYTEETREVTTAGPVPYIWGPDYKFIPTTEFRYFHVRMKNMGTQKESKILWKRADETQGDQTFSISANDLEYKDYVIDLSKNPEWYGIIKRSVFFITTSGAVGEKVSIDRIEFSRIDRRDCNGVWRGKAYKDKCTTCVGGNTGKTSITGCDTVKYVPPTTAYISVNSMPWDPSGLGTLCAGGTVWIRPQPAEVPGWSWTGPNGFTSSKSDFVLSNIQTNQAGTYIGTYTDANGNSNTAKYTITVHALPSATISTTTPTTFCEGGSVVLTSSAGSSYKWYIGTTLLANTTATLTANASGSYTVEVTNANACKATSAAKVVTVNALPTATISTTTPTTFCQGGSVVLSANSGTSYKWFNGATQVATTATYTATTAGSYTMEVTNASGCKATSTAKVVTVNALPTATISTTTPTTFFEGGSVVLTASVGSSYKWYNGATLLATTTATHTATASGSYTVEVTNANTCKATSTATVVTVNAIIPYISVNGKPWDPASAQTLCAGGNVWIRPQPAEVPGWSWTGPNGFTSKNSDFKLQNMQVNQSGNYVGNYTDGNGKIASTTYTITVIALSDAGTASAPASVCVGSNVEFKQTGGAGTFNGFQVQWDVTSGAWTNWAGANWTASSPGKTLYVRAQKTNGTCPSAYSAPVSIKVDTASDAGTASAPASVCVGSNVEFKQAGGTGTFNRFQVQWDVTSGAWANWDGVNWTATNPGQTLYVRAQKTNSTCPSAYSAPVAIKVNSLPKSTALATDELNGQSDGSITFTFADDPTRTNISFSIDNGTTYSTVADNTGSYSINNLAEGTYKLWTRWENSDCPVFLGAYTLKNNAVTSVAVLQESPASFKLYPNPVNELLNVQVNSLDLGKQVILLDSKGAEVFNMTINKNDFSIDVSNLNAGVYLLKVG